MGFGWNYWEHRDPYGEDSKLDRSPNHSWWYAPKRNTEPCDDCKYPANKCICDDEWCLHTYDCYALKRHSDCCGKLYQDEMTKYRIDEEDEYGGPTVASKKRKRRSMHPEQKKYHSKYLNRRRTAKKRKERNRAAKEARDEREKRLKADKEAAKEARLKWVHKFHCTKCDHRFEKRMSKKKLPKTKICSRCNKQFKLQFRTNKKSVVVAYSPPVVDNDALTDDDEGDDANQQQQESCATTISQNESIESIKPEH